MPYHLDAMHVKDIPEVVQIERESFSMTWPANSYKRELEQNRMARYVVLRYQPGFGEPPLPPSAPQPKRPFPLSLLPLPPPERPADDERHSAVVGYGGLWLMVDEAHITSIAVKPEFRGRGLGKLLMLSLFDCALRMNVRWLTLEARVGNRVARALYEQLGFREAGIRPRYYTDNGEDAVVMWSEDLRTPRFRERYARLKEELASRLTWTSSFP